MARKAFHSAAFFEAATPVTVTVTSSKTMNVITQDYASIDLQWASSDLTASVEIEAQNGEDAEFRALDFGGAIAITGASGSHEIVLTEMPFTSIRMKITVTGGSSGEVDAYVTSKSKGA